MTMSLRRSTPASVVRRRPSRSTQPLLRQRRFWGVIFVAPALIAVTMLMIIPGLQALYYSFTDWNGRSANWVGFANYTQGVFASPDFLRILLNTLLVVASVPFGVAFSLVIAHLLATHTWGRRLFRGIYFMPIALSWVVVGLTFGYLLSSRGPINDLLSAVGLSALRQDWLGTESTALGSLILVFNWAYFGINVVLLYTGMTTADPSVREAAMLDGASGWKMLYHIVLPQTRRYIELCLILTMSAAITGIFGLIYTMTSGGPGAATTTFEYVLYTRSFNLGHFSQRAAFGILLFLFSLVFAVLRLRSGVRADDK